jgi:hypothetical protein
MFQMQIYFLCVLILSSGAVSTGLEKVLRLSAFVADIYQQFPHSCIFIINPEAQQQGENWFYIIYSRCVCSEQKCADRHLGLEVPMFSSRNFTFYKSKFCGWKSNISWIFHIYQFRSECSTLCRVLCLRFMGVGIFLKLFINK